MAPLNDAELVELTQLDRRMFGGNGSNLSGAERDRWEALRAARAVPATEETTEAAELETSDLEGVDEQPAQAGRPRLPWKWAVLGAGTALFLSAAMLVLGGSFSPRPLQVIAPEPFDIAILSKEIPSGSADGDFMHSIDLEQLMGPDWPFTGRAMFETEHFMVVTGEGQDGSICMSAISRDPSVAFSGGQYACAWDPLQPQLMTYYVTDVGGEQSVSVFRMELRAGGALSVWQEKWYGDE